jgi:hypothetical protein
MRYLNFPSQQTLFPLRTGTYGGKESTGGRSLGPTQVKCGENNVTRFNVVGPIRRTLPGGINSSIHSLGGLIINRQEVLLLYSV